MKAAPSVWQDRNKYKAAKITAATTVTEATAVTAVTAAAATTATEKQLKRHLQPNQATFLFLFLFSSISDFFAQRLKRKKEKNRYLSIESFLRWLISSSSPTNTPTPTPPRACKYVSRYRCFSCRQFLHYYGHWNLLSS